MNGRNTTELAYRAGDGVEVSLLWSRAESRLTVVVSDSRTGDWFELPAHPENALDVFHHPYAYAAFRGVEYGCESAAALAA
jgi:hypothetical protein